ncbi:MAG TPA: carbon monoxide dehydrogenase subunit G [Stellaceae bacterium]|nr:carbon monoxide dehydrogenase subunit G [Stellaceae bacterium]
MDMTGEFRLAAPRDVVWKALNDPEVLKQSIPGCEEIVKQSDTEMTAKVAARVGPVSARFSGKVTLSDLDPPNGYTISGEGQGGVAGFAKGGAKVALKEDAGGTLLSYTVQAQVGGKLAQIGSRLIDATARKMADEFFTRFQAAVAAAAPAPAAAAAATGPTPVPPPAAPQLAPTPAAGKRVSPAIWVAILTAVVLLLLYLYTRG